MNESTPTAAPAAIKETPPSAIVAELASNMPTPTGPVTPLGKGHSPTTPQGTTPRDANGTAFDPSKHAANPDGTPKRDRLNRFYSNRLGGAKAKGQGETPEPMAKQASFIPEQPLAQPVSEGPTGTPTQTPRNVGEVVDNATAETIIGIIQMALVLIGEEEGVLSDTQKALIRPPLLRVLSKYSIGADVMPAEVELALVLVAILIEKIKQGGKTATWFAKAKAWAVAFFFRRQGAQIGREVRREVPANLVASLSAEVERLKAERDAARAAKQEAAA